MTKHPEIQVQLSGSDGNAFAVLGAVSRALRRAGCDEAEVKEFNDEATSGGYDHLLTTAMAWVEVE